jgi:predicted Zn-dependent protease
VAFSRGDHAACAETLLSVRETAMRFGGSNAQRDVLSLTLAEAALRGRDVPLSRALASERTRLRPANPAAWGVAARALELAGDRDGAGRAREQAARLSAASGGPRGSSARAPAVAGRQTPDTAATVGA